MKTAIAALLWSVLAIDARAQENPTKLFEEFEKRFPPAEKNAAAGELERLSLELGLEPYGESGDEHPAKADRDAYLQASFGVWLDAQVKTSDDSIASPPPRLAEFLERRQSAIWRIVTLLGREVPEWAFDVRKERHQLNEVLLVTVLSKVLLSAALVEERSGRHAQAGDLLEASWSLYRSQSSLPDLLSQLISVALAKLEAGVLRKMNEPPFEWLHRMSGGEPRERFLDVLRSEPLVLRARRPETSLGSSDDAWIRAWRAFTDRLRELSPCESSKLSNEEIWKPGAEVLLRARDEGGDPQLETLAKVAIPNIMDGHRRLARLMVDRELTARILDLRQERAADRNGRWPEKLFDAESRVCPGAAYEYQTRGAAMSIRFQGSVADPGAPALVLPLSFEVRAPRPTPSATPTRRPTVTPTPRPTLTPLRGGA